MPVLLVLVLAVLATLALAGRGVAAPVIETPDVVCIAGSLAPECLTTLAEEIPGTASGLLHAGGLLLDSVAITAIEARESIAAVPLPAAGWLLVVGFGGLGLFARRRRGALPSLRRTGDGIEPAATTLRGSARIDAPAPRRARLDRRDPDLRDRLRALMLSGEGLCAFAPGDASPDRPCGGAGHRYPPTAGRAPPAAANGRAAGVIPSLRGTRMAFTDGLRLSRACGAASPALKRASFARIAVGTSANQPAPVAVSCENKSKNGSNPHLAAVSPAEWSVAKPRLIPFGNIKRGVIPC